MDHSADHGAPPYPSFEPASRDASTQSLFTQTNGSTLPSEYRSSLGRDRSSRETRRSLHSEIELRFGQMHAGLQAEKRRAEIAERRAEDAERKLQDFAAHFKAVNDARLVALRDAGRANEELKLYRLQLDHAQQEIYRAQDVIGMVDRQRHTAEQDAANNRSRVRELQKTVVIQLARDEAYRKGLEEGLARGRALGVAADGPVFQGEDSDSETDSRSPSPEYDPRAYGNPTKPRSIAPSEHSRAPPRSHVTPLPVYPPLPQNPPNPGPSRSRAPSVHPSENDRPLSVRAPSLHPIENIPPKSVAPSIQRSPSIKPISIRNFAPTPIINNAVVPPDNFIPSLDADNILRIPPPSGFLPSGFQRTPEWSTSNLPPSQDALPTRPRSSLNASISNVTAQQPRQSGHHRNISSGSSSSALSALDIGNSKPFNAALRSPMTMIPEVNSAYSGSPQPQGSVVNPTDHAVHHQHSVSDYSVRRSQAQPSIVPPDRQSQYTARPPSRSSYAGSWADQQQQKRDSHISTSTIPNIAVQPPSKPVSQISRTTDSVLGGTSVGGGYSPSMRQPTPLPSIHESPQQEYSPSPLGGMPGGYTLAGQVSSSEPPVIPRSSGYDPQRDEDDDDAVSSSMSAGAFTTPPAKQKTIKADWSSTLNSLRHPPIMPVDSTWAAGSSSTKFWPNEPEADAASMRSQKKSSRGSVR